MSVEVVPYTIDHWRALLGDENSGSGCLNQIAGPAFTMVEGGQVLACGGIRVQGIGQAWTVLSEEAKQRSITTMRAAQDVVTQAIAHERLYRVYAEATVDAPGWFEFLGFRQQNNLFVR